MCIQSFCARMPIVATKIVAMSMIGFFIRASKADSSVSHKDTIASKGRGRRERVRPTCGRSGDASESRAVDVQVWIVEVRRVGRSDRIQPEFRGNAFLHSEPSQNVQIEIEDARASPVR